MTNPPSSNKSEVSASAEHMGQVHMGQVAGRDIINNYYDGSSSTSAPVPAHSEETLQLPLDTIPTPSTIPPTSRLLYPVNPHFAGREEELKQLAHHLQQETPIIITGTGGVGKSQLASAFAHRYGRYFPGGVFWLDFSQPNNIKAEIAICGGPQYLNLPAFAALDLETQVGAVQRAWREPVTRLLQ